MEDNIKVIYRVSNGDDESYPYDDDFNINGNNNSNFCNCCKKMNKHILTWIITLIFIAPIIISSSLLLMISVSCIISSNSDIEQCQNLFFNTQRIKWIVYVSTTLQLILNIIIIFVLGRIGLIACFHSRIPIKQKKKVSLCCCFKKSHDCRCIGSWIIYWIPVILLQIDIYWNFGFILKEWILTVLVSITIFLNTWQSMTIFPLEMTDYQDLENKNLIDDFDTDLSDNDKNNFLDTTGDKYKSASTLESYSICCVYNYLPRFSWSPVILFINFYINICWFFYNIARFLLILTSKHIFTSSFIRVNIILSIIAIIYRYFYFNGYWKKMLNMSAYYPCMDIENIEYNNSVVVK